MHREAPPVELRAPLSPDRLDVLLRAVTLVPLETVTLKRAGVLPHDAVPRDLRNDRGRGYREALPVASNDRFRWNGDIGKPVPVDEHKARSRPERIDGDFHRLECRLENIDAVYLGRLHNPEAVGDAVLQHDLIQALALALRNEFRVSYPEQMLIRFAYDRSRNHRPRERPPPSLVHPGNDTRRIALSQAIEPDQLFERDPAAGSHSSTFPVFSAMRAALPFSSLR